MPQMSPMDWLLLFFYFFFVYFLILMIIYFYVDINDKNNLNEGKMLQVLNYEIKW